MAAPAKSTTIKVVEGDNDIVIMTKDWQPAIFPLSGVILGTAYYLIALKSRDEVKAKGHYHLHGVSKDGFVTLLGVRGRYPMDMFAELLHPESAKPTPSPE